MRESRRKWLGVITLLACLAASGAVVHRFWMRQLAYLTGDAEWVWLTGMLARSRPPAGLFVAGFTLDAPPTAALLKVCGDREYVVWVNSTVAACGWSRPGIRGARRGRGARYALS